ncbi:MAG TPA: hypothetical protein VEA79_14010, partial [Phenylobacterium sp.]|nr:hypothetical protein [Phenylobacterium sp.]
MLAKNTVLILGAGASVNFGLPTGAGLIKRIAEALGPASGPMGDQAIAECIRALGPEQARPLLIAARMIAHGVRNFRSIDDMLFTHEETPGVVTVGKLAIAATILRAEHSSTLARLDTDGLSERAAIMQALADSWIAGLGGFLAAGVKRRDAHLAFQNLTI